MATEGDSRLYPVFASAQGCQRVLGASDDARTQEVRTLISFLEMCDGRRPLSAIVNAFDEEQRTVILNEVRALVQSQAIQDVRTEYRRFHEVSRNPPLAPPAFSEAEVENWPLFRPSVVGEPLACQSHVSEAFENGFSFSRRSSPLTDLLGTNDNARLLGNLIECVRRAYQFSGDKRTVASAGALYPIVVYVAFPSAAHGAASYTFAWYDPFSSDFFRIADHPVQNLTPAFPPDPLVQRLINCGVGLVFICCDTHRTCAKYANRGYRFALLEAGSVWQNLDLAANNLSIPIRAFGGFIDEKCSELLSLPDHVQPVLTVLLGATE